MIFIMLTIYYLYNLNGLYDKRNVKIYYVKYLKCLADLNDDKYTVYYLYYLDGLYVDRNDKNILFIMFVMFRGCI